MAAALPTVDAVRETDDDTAALPRATRPARPRRTRAARPVAPCASRPTRRSPNATSRNSRRAMATSRSCCCAASRRRWAPTLPELLGDEAPEQRLMRRFLAELPPHRLEDALFRMMRDYGRDDASRRTRIALVGLRGAGKTTLGVALARELQLAVRRARPRDRARGRREPRRDLPALRPGRLPSHRAPLPRARARHARPLRRRRGRRHRVRAGHLPAAARPLLHGVGQGGARRSTWAASSRRATSGRWRGTPRRWRT